MEIWDALWIVEIVTQRMCQTFLQNVEEFRNLEELPVDLNFGPEFTADFFLDKRAKWHHSCHQKFTVSRLHRAKDRKRKQDADDSEKLHEYATRHAKVFLRTMASEMDDSEMLTKYQVGT